MAQNLCDRCDKAISDNWESSFTGITVTAQSCSVAYDKLVEGGYTLRDLPHPAFPVMEPQTFTMDVGPGKPYRLCWDCHAAFLRMLGDFLRLPEYVRNARLVLKTNTIHKEEV